MEKINLNFFGEEVTIDTPKDITSLRAKIAEKYSFSTSDVAEIIIKCNNEELFNNETRKIIREKLLLIINEKLNELSDKKIESLKEYNKITLEILKQLEEIKFEINIFINQTKEFNYYKNSSKYTK